jgi:hypothetical protein
MAITTYSGLSTAVFRRLNRTAETTVFDDCISLAEAEINRRLALAPVRPMHTKDAAFSIAAQYVNHPSGILDAETLSIDDTPVLATDPENMDALFEQDDTTGQPQFYCHVGSQFRFYPAPDTTYTATLIYWAKVPNLTSGASSNWLSLAHPDVYFHGILAHAYQEYFDPENADVQAGLFDTAIQKVLSAYPARANKRPLTTDLAHLIPGNGYSVFTDR